MFPGAPQHHSHIYCFSSLRITSIVPMRYDRSAQPLGVNKAVILSLPACGIVRPSGQFFLLNIFTRPIPIIINWGQYWYVPSRSLCWWDGFRVLNCWRLCCSCCCCWCCRCDWIYLPTKIENKNSYVLIHYSNNHWLNIGLTKTLDLTRKSSEPAVDPAVKAFSLLPLITCPPGGQLIQVRENIVYRTTTFPRNTNGFLGRELLQYLGKMEEINCMFG